VSEAGEATGSVPARLERLGLTLPAPPAPAASYQPFARSGDLVFTAGQLPLVDGTLPRTGRCGDTVTTEQAAELARAAAVNVLSVARAAAGGSDGDLDRVRVVKLTVFVASTPDFTEQHLVAHGASDLLAEALGDAGVHARSAVGVASLPLDSPVEVEAILQLG
jgi:enamine deaminase RidA (YjgF/YER057c/UK114 family)